MKRKTFLGIMLLGAAVSAQQTNVGFTNILAYRFITDGSVFKVECQLATNDWWTTMNEFRTLPAALAYRDLIITNSTRLKERERWIKPARRAGWTIVP